MAVRHSVVWPKHLNSKIASPMVIKLVYDLTAGEKLLLHLVDHLSTEDERRKNEGRGVPLANKTTAYEGIEKKISMSLEMLKEYTKYLDNMEHEKYQSAENIKRRILDPISFQTILQNILDSRSICDDMKMEFDEMMFALSTNHLLKQIDDAAHAYYFQEPVTMVKERLALVTSGMRKDRRLQEANALYEKRLARLNHTATFQPLAGHFNAECKICAAFNRAKTKPAAISGIEHDQLCPYRADRRRKLKEIKSHYRVARPGL